jgi:hypothetical protein
MFSISYIRFLLENNSSGVDFVAVKASQINKCEIHTLVLWFIKTKRLSVFDTSSAFL